MTIAIKKFELTGRPDRDDASTTKAIFDVEIHGMRLIGCAIVRKADGYNIVVTPKSEHAGQGAFYFVDDDLLAEFRAVGMRAYEALGGDDSRPRVDTAENETLRRAGL